MVLEEEFLSCKLVSIVISLSVLAADMRVQQ